jgi:hypothetical protein
MPDKGLKATDEVAVIKGLAKNFPEKHNLNVRAVFELGAAYILYKAIRNGFTKQ